MLLELIVREQLGLICKFDLVKRANQMEHLKVRPQLHSPLPSRISVMYSKSVSTCRVFALIIGIDEV
jgi:hypothetical protein